MPKFPLPVVFMAACVALPAFSLELSDLHLPLTRDEADKALSRDYSFRVLEDMTVRRSWSLKDRTVSVDFSPKEGDKALLIFVDYARPVAPAVAEEDATMLLGAKPGAWQQLNSKRALRLGMEAAEGLKLSGGRFLFRELDESGQVLRLAYYAGVPKGVRWELADDARESGKTAMGARTATGKSEVLWRDEERRRGVSASSSASTLAAAAAAVVAEDAPAAAPSASSSKGGKMQKRPEEPVDPVAAIKEFFTTLTPMHYAIGGAVVALLLLMRWVKAARAAKRRAMVADYIMKHGVIHTKGPRKK